MTTEIAPEWLVKKAKAARSEMQKQLDERQVFSSPDPSPSKTAEIRLRIGNYDEILGWMKEAELHHFEAKIELKYK
jgi:hypothetical protein